MSQLVLGGIKQLDRRLRRVEDVVGAPVYGAYWDKGSSPTLTRTHDAVGMEAAVGVDGEWAHNDFDGADIFGQICPASDELGNVFIRIPKLYIRKTDGPGYKTWAVSRQKRPGFYLPWCFWDFERQRELPYVDVGKHLASLGDSNRLESKPGVHPLVSTHIVNMRNYAQNNNTDSLRGYQQLDIHVYDVLQTLMTIEFATLDMQTVMRGFTNGEYNDSHVAIATESNANRIILAAGQESGYRVGQSIGIGTSRSSNAVLSDRVIVGIEPAGDGVALVFDGPPVDIAEGDVVANRGYMTGWSSRIASSSGSIGSNTDGKYPAMYRGIESPYGDIYQFVDGVNITDHQAWVAHNAEDYASNVFASPYERLAYTNNDANGYTSEMGFDSEHPYAEFPVAADGSSSTYYSDYYYQNTGQRIALVGGHWAHGGRAGPWLWNLNASSSTSYVTLGGRLLKKPL